MYDYMIMILEYFRWFTLVYPDSFVGGAVASWLVSSTPNRAVRVRALGHCVVFLGKTLNSQCLSLPGCINAYRQI